MDAVEVVTDLSPKQLRRKARTQTDARVRIRLLAIANVLDGMSREQAAQSVGLSRNALHLSRDGIVLFRGWKLQEILSQEFNAEYAL